MQKEAFDIIKHLFMIKNSQQSGNRGNIPKHIKGHIQQTHCQHHTQWAKTISITFMIGNKTGMSSFTSLLQHSTGSSSHKYLIRMRDRVEGWGENEDNCN